MIRPSYLLLVALSCACGSGVDGSGTGETPSAGSSQGAAGGDASSAGGPLATSTAGAAAVQADAGPSAADSLPTAASGSSASGGMEAPRPADSCEWSACGGNVVGRWRLSSLCLAHVGVGSVEADCGLVRRTETVAIGRQGTFEFGSDGRFIYDWMTTTDRITTTWSSCFEQAGIASCSDALFGFESCPDAACALEGGDCRCTGTCEDAAQGTIPWAANESEVVFDCAAASDPANCPPMIRVCVVDNTMWLDWRADTFTAIRE